MKTKTRRDEINNNNNNKSRKRTFSKTELFNFNGKTIVIAAVS